MQLARIQICVTMIFAIVIDFVMASPIISQQEKRDCYTDENGIEHCPSEFYEAHS